MAVRRFVWRACYEALAKRVSTPDWAFMNYGYAPATADVDVAPLQWSDERDRLCIQLYLHAIDNSDLQARDVLEVGSGRGGGALFIGRYLRPRFDDGVGFLPGSGGFVQPVPVCARLDIRVWRRPINAVPGLLFRRGGQHRVLTLL